MTYLFILLLGLMVFNECRRARHDLADDQRRLQISSNHRGSLILLLLAAAAFAGPVFYSLELWHKLSVSA